jgi:hypothetical protein
MYSQCPTSITLKVCTCAKGNSKTETRAFVPTLSYDPGQAHSHPTICRKARAAAMLPRITTSDLSHGGSTQAAAGLRTVPYVHIAMLLPGRAAGFIAGSAVAAAICFFFQFKSRMKQARCCTKAKGSRRQQQHGRPLTKFHRVMNMLHSMLLSRSEFHSEDVQCLTLPTSRICQRQSTCLSYPSQS